MTAVALAYGFIWSAIFAYVVFIGRRLARVHAELDEVRRRLERMKQ